MRRYCLLLRIACLFAGACLFMGACTTASKEWPVKHITLPPGSTAAGLPAVFANDPNMISSEDWRGGGWFRCFDCPGGWDAVRAHFENCLSPLGYAYDAAETLDMAPPGASPDGILRVYASPSGRIKAALMDLRACARYGDGFGGGGRYMIMIGTDAPAQD